MSSRCRRSRVDDVRELRLCCRRVCGEIEAAVLLGGDGVVVTGQADDVLEVAGMDSAQVGLIAARAGIALVELTPQHASLEEAFMEITRDSVEFAPVSDPGVGLVGAGGAKR